MFEGTDWKMSLVIMEGGECVQLCFFFYFPSFNVSVILLLPNSNMKEALSDSS